MKRCFTGGNEYVKTAQEWLKLGAEKYPLDLEKQWKTNHDQRLQCDGNGFNVLKIHEGNLSDSELCAATLITLLKVFSFNACEIDVDACLIQMFSIHIFFSMVSGILFTVAFDCHMAISNPLRHTTFLTDSTIAKIGVEILLWGVAVLSLGLFLIKWMRF